MFKKYGSLRYDNKYKADYSKYKALIVQDTCEYNGMYGCDVREVVFDCDEQTANEISQHVRESMFLLNETDDAESFKKDLEEYIECTMIPAELYGKCEDDDDDALDEGRFASDYAQARY